MREVRMEELIYAVYLLVFPKMFCDIFYEWKTKEMITHLICGFAKYQHRSHWLQYLSAFHCLKCSPHFTSNPNHNLILPVNTTRTHTQSLNPPSHYFIEIENNVTQTEHSEHRNRLWTFKIFKVGDMNSVK